VDTDRANTLTEVRAEILNENTRSLVLINGGGAVAVASWLQAVWGETWATSMLRPQIIGTAILLGGVMLAALCPMLRYMSFFHPKTLTPRKNPWWWTNAIASLLSVAAFAVGMGFVVAGAWCAVNDRVV
jgi:polyferredoxin